MDKTTIALVALCGACCWGACGSDDAVIPDGSTSDGTTGMDGNNIVDTGGQQDTFTPDTGSGVDGSNPTDSGMPGKDGGIVTDGSKLDVNLPDVGKG